MAIDFPVNKSFVLMEAKSGIRCTIQVTSFGSRNPKAGPCTLVSGRNQILCSCRALQPLCPSGELKPSHQTKRTSIHEGELRYASPSVLSLTMKWYIPIILACQYGNAARPSTLSSCDRTMMSVCVCGLADSSILHPLYVINLNQMVLCSYIWFCSMMMLLSSRPEKYSSSPSYGRPLMHEYRWLRRHGQKSCVNTSVIGQQQTKCTLT